MFAGSQRADRCLPAVPPARFTRHARYYTPEGHCLLQQYFVGFRDGQEVAVASGLRPYLTVPVLLPLLISTAEICGGFDWDDGAFERAYVELERALFGQGHQYGALTPVIGIATGGTTIELGGGLRLRLAATGELAKLWPEANGLLPADFGREPDRLCVLELERALQSGATEPPDSPGEFADAVTAIRLATAAPLAA